MARVALTLLIAFVTPLAFGDDEPFDASRDIRAMLRHVAVSDRTTDSARSALRRVVGEARARFESAEASEKQGKPAGRAAAFEGLTRGLRDLLAALATADGELAKAGKSLDEAREEGTALNRALAARARDLMRKALEAEAALEVERKNLKTHWAHFRSPKLAGDDAAMKDAKVLVELHLSKATALWRVAEARRARRDHERNLQRRLLRALAAIKRRGNELRALRDGLKAYRLSLLNPLDNARPAPTFGRLLTWPPPLEARLKGLDRKFTPPLIPKVPSQWRLRDRVTRFIRGAKP